MSLQGFNLSEVATGFGSVELTVPNRRLWRVVTIMNRIITSGLPGVRQPVIEVADPSGEVQGIFPSAATQKASETLFHIFGAGLVEQPGMPTQINFSHLAPIFMREGETIRFTDSVPVDPAGDEFKMRLSVEVKTF